MLVVILAHAQELDEQRRNCRSRIIRFATRVQQNTGEGQYASNFSWLATAGRIWMSILCEAQGRRRQVPRRFPYLDLVIDDGSWREGNALSAQGVNIGTLGMEAIWKVKWKISRRLLSLWLIKE